MMVKNKYPLPLISELVSQLQGARYFTKLDVHWGFNNVCIKPRDKWKTAFRTNQSLFEPLVMFFRMTNSLTTFQTMINDIFWDLIAEGIMVVYLDDILIFTRMEEEHAKAIRQVLQVLQKNKLFLHLSWTYHGQTRCTVKESQSQKWSLGQWECSPSLTGIPCSACSGRSRTDRCRTEDLVRYPQGELERRPRGTHS